MRVLAADLDAVARRMRSVDRVALAVHEQPDLDAVGAAAGMLDLFGQLGTPATLCVAEGELLPFEESMLPSDAVARRPPAPGETLFALDSGSLPRLALDLGDWRGEVVDIDHHHDNTRFGDLVLVRPQASSTSEIVCDLARALELTPGRAAAIALYAGISFDSGHFRHTSTSAATFATAAWLAALGVDVTAVYRELYERRSPGAVRLEGRALAGMRTVADGRALIAVLTRADYAASGAADHEAEGVVERLRAVDGVDVVALVKEQEGSPRVRVSLRSSGADVSALAARRGGGGHVQAAGFEADESPEEVTEWLSSALARLLSTASS
ncbi:MAG TPA: DHH family phosphoesterase [Thermoleophilia bacterium]|nr:DHH family phosphoesterase [Thermoleophilia bacterium]HQG03198.1 DHH family phosphoesterase [Thermoleophilia bacterium]HQG54769.1 DHH family phosphoesterase [Thermoleophilia bacterium]HQJ97011.1 DHH family phosphoesterase [Thermoleophilia bacterium]